MPFDIIELLRVDPGRRTIGELLQDRAAALHEIIQLRKSIEQMQSTWTQRVQIAQKNAVDAKPQLRSGYMLKLSEVSELLSVSRSTVYRWVEDGAFPPPIRVSAHAIRWSADAIADWRDKVALRTR